MSRVCYDYDQHAIFRRVMVNGLSSFKHPCAVFVVYLLNKPSTFEYICWLIPVNYYRYFMCSLFFFLNCLVGRGEALLIAVYGKDQNKSHEHTETIIDKLETWKFPNSVDLTAANSNGTNYYYRLILWIFFLSKIHFHMTHQWLIVHIEKSN